MVAAARNEEALHALAEETSGDPGTVLPVTTDVDEYATCSGSPARLWSGNGRIDTWVNGAAQHEYALFEDTTPEEFSAVLSTNAMGQVHGSMRPCRTSSPTTRAG